MYGQPTPPASPSQHVRPWWIAGRHERPVLDSDDEAIAGVLDRTVRALLRSLTGSLRRAAAHVVWAVGLWARRQGDAPWVTTSYVRAGAAVGERVARRAIRLVLRALGCARDRFALVRARPEAIAAAYDAARWAIAEGVAVEPAVAVVVDGSASVLVQIPADRERGKCRCPCGRHRRGDTRPSALFDLARRRLTCMAFGVVLALSPSVSGAWTAAPRFPASDLSSEQAIDNRYSSRPESPSSRSSQSSGAPPVRIATGRLADLGGGRRALSPSVSSSRSWPALLAWHDRCRTGPAARRRAEARMARRDAHVGAGWGDPGGPPDALVRVDDVVPRWDAYARRWPLLVSLDPAGVSRILLDLDGLELGLGVGWEDACARLDGAARASPLLDGVLTVVETSPLGVQAVARLRRRRRDGQAFLRRPDVRLELRRVGDRMIGALDRGGHVDASAWGVGRHARLPGWRDRDGCLVVARLRGCPLADRAAA